MVLSIFQRFLDWLKALFFKEEMELSLVGLQYSGKTTFVNVIGKIRAHAILMIDLFPNLLYNVVIIPKYF